MKDFYKHEKTSNPNFSHRYFVKKAGFSSPVQLYRVTEGKRNLTRESMQKFAQGLSLGKKEQQYFEILVSFNQAKSPEAKRYYLELLNNMRKEKIGTPLDEGKFEYLSKWFYPAIRELVYLPDFSDNPDWIKRRLKNRVTIKEIKEAIETLLRLELIKKDEAGKYVQVDKNIITDDGIAHEAAYIFHQQILSIAKETLASTYEHERQFSGILTAMSQKQFVELKKMVREFEDTVIRFLNDNPDVPDSVYYLNTTFFSLTEK